MEVDPKLFVTCRLCLEDLGQYQIVPSVQQQIKYCFDIEVEPFDGLPQLICMKCKENLNNFHTVKTTYCEKQTNLRKKVMKNKETFCIQQQQDTVSSSQQAPETVEPEQPTNQTTNEPYKSKKNKSKRKRQLLHSSSSGDSESEQSFQTSKSQKQKYSRRVGEISMPWELDYKKLTACKLCNSFWSNRKSIAIHNRSHDHLRETYKNIFNRECTLNLTKIDNKPNITGSSDMVVHTSNKIIEPGDPGSYFYTIYSKDDDSANHRKDNFLQNEDENKCLIQESDEEERIAFKPAQRKRRLISRSSSNETVVIESNSKTLLSDEEDSVQERKSTARNSIETPLNNGQCINIDDSSDSESDQDKLEKSGKVKQPIAAKLGDYKIIQGIISMCVKSYMSKNSENEMVDNQNNIQEMDTSNESQLKHKLLSIGRKIINKQGFSCTGLLRYMEHRNLEIVWIAQPPSSHPKDTNYIRILTKLRGELNLDDEPGWVSVSEMSQSKPSSNSVPLITMKVAAPSKTLCNVPAQAAKVPIPLLKPNIETSQPVNQIHNQAQLDAMPAMLSIVDNNATSSDSQKLLNASPVANPKKLPKKLGIESRCNKAVARQSIRHTTDDADSNFCLPIITSTTSLAPIQTKQQTQDADNKKSVSSEEINRTETPAAPRIKVKPVSELMSESALVKMKEHAISNNTGNMLVLVSPQPNVWPRQEAVNVFVPNITPKLLSTSPLLQIPQLPSLNTGTAYQPMAGPMTGPMASNINTSIILDTPAFPNTKTKSPLKYVRNLMQLHKIFLLDPTKIEAKNFLCLIKFKVKFKQDHQTDPPVTLQLSLLCCKDQFCFQVRDQNLELVDLTQISANWQWEILQTYRGDVSNKVLQNARKSGQELFDITNNFFCLLKSINCRKVVEEPMK